MRGEIAAIKREERIKPMYRSDVENITIKRSFIIRSYFSDNKYRINYYNTVNSMSKLLTIDINKIKLYLHFIEHKIKSIHIQTEVFNINIL